jgi:magnesium transporter
LDTAQLVKTASVYARDLFFTLNLTSRQDRDSHYVRRTVSAILPRGGHSILLSFGNVRAVCHIEQGVLVFDAHQPAAQDFVCELAESFRQNAGSSVGAVDETAEPHELIFLEKVLRDTVESYHRRLRIFDPIVDSLLDQVDNNDITSPDTGVHQLGPLKDALQSFDLQVRQSQECLEDLLNNDDEMLDLLLTERQAADRSGRPVDFERHEHVEFLLGVYARQISNINMEINLLLQRLQSKQEFVTIALSGYRNRMVRMNVHLAIAGLSIAFSTALAGFFGMNVVHGLEQSTTAFGTIVLLSSSGSLLISIGCLNFLSGRTMRQLAEKRLQEIETLTSALSDMPALDHTFKTTVEKGQSLDKTSFAALLRYARHSKKASIEELDLLFDVFDKIKDEKLTSEDFPTIKRFSS